MGSGGAVDAAGALSALGPTVVVVAADSPPYRRCEPPVPVVVHVPGQPEPYPGMVEGWRGDRVKVSWSSGLGLRHTGFLPASSVTRVTELVQDVGPVEPDAT